MTKPPGLLASDLIKLKNLLLTGKLVSEELMLGIHSSKRSGIGVEFEQYKHYTAGDDPKGIDWKLYARTEKHLVRESSTESDRKIRFVLDLSGSMNYEENSVSRLQYAKIMLASLSYLGYIQNDQMSLYGLQNGTVNTLVAGNTASFGKQAFQKILVGLENVTASGTWVKEEDVKHIFPELKNRGKEQLIFVSDFLQSSDEWIRFIRSLAGPSREIVIFQILGDQEIHLSMKGFYRFKDLETGKELELDADSIRTSYNESAEQYFEKLKSDLQIPHVSLVRARLSEPIGMILKAFLTRRKG